MATDDFREILDLAKQLPLADQKKLAAELQQGIAGDSGKRHSILKLRGLGKEIWAGIDAQDYVREDCEAWSH
jgi:hypothetical protein